VFVFVVDDVEAVDAWVGDARLFRFAERKDLALMTGDTKSFSCFNELALPCVMLIALMGSLIP